MPTFEKILVPTDFSAHSAKALASGIDLARRFGASLLIAHVQQSAVDAGAGAYMLPPALFEGVPANRIKDLEQLLAKTRGEAEAAGLKQVESVLLEGIPDVELVKLARERGCDLIVLGTHGRTGLARALLGSVAERVVRKAPCAVMAVRLPEAAESDPRPARTASA